MKLSSLFLFGAIVELIAGTGLLVVYDNPIGYLGLIASVIMGVAMHVIDSYAK